MTERIGRFRGLRVTLSRDLRRARCGQVRVAVDPTYRYDTERLLGWVETMMGMGYAVAQNIGGDR